MDKLVGKYVMDPDDLNKAARELLDMTAEIDESLNAITSDSISMNGKVDLAEFTCADKLIEATDEWRTIRILRLRKRVERLGMFLAAHAAEQVNLDEFSASDFNGVVDPDLFPESKPGNDNPPVSGSDEPQPQEAQ